MHNHLRRRNANAAGPDHHHQHGGVSNPADASGKDTRIEAGNARIQAGKAREAGSAYRGWSTRFAVE
ncbi:hypothetical protein GCM10020218_004580 [Dactylosporangium vinaceum]